MSSSREDSNRYSLCLSKSLTTKTGVISDFVTFHWLKIEIRGCFSNTNIEGFQLVLRLDYSDKYKVFRLKVKHSELTTDQASFGRLHFIILFEWGLCCFV